jgi:hypothetical protein
MQGGATPCELAAVKAAAPVMSNTASLMADDRLVWVLTVGCTFIIMPPILDPWFSGSLF